jgi:manganese/zinc/iron transport system ATP- binding protein
MMLDATRTATRAALSLRGLTVSYLQGVALTDVSVDLAEGAMTAIVGPNGAGKSTLLKAALDIIPRDSGTVSFLGEPLAVARPRIAYVPQRASVDWEFPVRVIDVVLMGMTRELGLLGRVKARHKAEAMACLTRVGMADYATRAIGALSGGQQQRVFLARALAQGAELYLLDEPFAGVDAATESAIVSLLQSLRDEGASIIAVHHDLSTVKAYFDRVVLLNRVVIAEGPVEAAFTPEALARTYGAAFPLIAT